MFKRIIKVLLLIIIAIIIFEKNYTYNFIETHGKKVNYYISYEDMDLYEEFTKLHVETSNEKRSLRYYEIDNEEAIKRISRYNDALSVLLMIAQLLLIIIVAELLLNILSIKKIKKEDKNREINYSKYNKRLKRLYLYKIILGIILIIFLVIRVVYFKLSVDTIRNHTDSSGNMTLSYDQKETTKCCYIVGIDSTDMQRFIVGMILIIILELINMMIKKKKHEFVFSKKEFVCSMILSLLLILMFVFRAPVAEFELTISWRGGASDNTGKPIIYLYPENTTDVHVSLGNPDLILCSYPKYQADVGWNVTAEPNGNLLYGDKSLYALYWEGESRFDKKIQDDGFVVKGENTIEFLEEKLRILGLNEREAEEFIVYWLPQMENNKYNYIRFETREEIDYNMPLDITPKPDTLIRIVMDWCEIDSEAEANKLRNSIREQELITPERTGFVAIEWGGSKIN